MNAFSYRVQTLQPSAIREILKFTADPEVISFAAGNPAPEAFPTEEIARITNEILTTTPIDALQYSITEGYTPLRNWIKDDLKKKGMFDENDERLRFAALTRFMRAAHSGQYLARLEPGVNSAPHTAHFLAFSRWNSAVSSSLSCGNTAVRNHRHNRE